jgi:poly(hydroxyalkanoate) depolymerase family esterase
VIVRRALLGLALVGGLFALVRPVDAADAVPSRSYILHVPPGAPEGRPLVVYLHGCIQTAEQAEAASGLSRLADQEGFYAVYPRQNVTAPSTAPLADGNGVGCWNWFLPGANGEQSAVVDIVRTVVSEHNLDASRVYVAGVSAGADLAVILAAEHPDVFAAAGAFAGCPYTTCSDVSGQLAYAAMGDRARVVPMFVVQGTGDTLNNVAMGSALTTSWVGVSDLADDGFRNLTVSPVPGWVDHRGLNSVDRAAPGTGEPCVRNQNWPCVGGVLGLSEYPSTSARWVDSAGCTVVSELLVHLLGHNQPGASSGPFTDPLGPDITTPMWEFLRQHTLAERCAGEPEVGIEPTT